MRKHPVDAVHVYINLLIGGETDHGFYRAVDFRNRQYTTSNRYFP